MSTHTHPCLCRQCGHDTDIDGGFRLPQKQTESDRRRLLNSLGCDRLFDRTTFQSFMSNEQTRSTQKISKHHFTVAQLKQVQGGNIGLKSDAVADIPLNQMMKPVHPVGLMKITTSTKRKSDEPHPHAPSSSRTRRAPGSTGLSSQTPMSPFEASACDCGFQHPSDISPHPMPSLPPASCESPLPPAASTSLPEMTVDEYEKLVSNLKAQLASAQQLIKVMEHSAAQRYPYHVTNVVWLPFNMFTLLLNSSLGICNCSESFLTAQCR